MAKLLLIEKKNEECPACGNSEPKEVRECTVCGCDKCEMCDMGDDVGCPACEDGGDE